MKASSRFALVSVLLLAPLALAQPEQARPGLISLPMGAGTDAPPVLAPPANAQSVTTIGTRAPLGSLEAPPSLAISGPTANLDTALVSFALTGFAPSMIQDFEFFIGSVHHDGAGSGATVNGAGVSMINDIAGVIWAEIARPALPGHGPAHGFGAAVDLRDGSGYLFLQQEQMNLNEAASMLTLLHQRMNKVLNPNAPLLPAVRVGSVVRAPDPGHLEETLTIDGQWLSIAEVQEQVFQQTGCRLELDSSVYYVGGCER